MKIIPNYTKAAYFAAIKHKGQLRKNANNEPYINHPLQVANFILDSGVNDPVTLCAAVLHDTLEDTETTEEQIKTLFGEEVLKIVEECSDDKDLGKVQRKVHQIEHSKHISKQAKIVKLADKLSNMQSLSISPPQGWSESRIKGYVLWGSLVCDEMKGINQYIEDKLHEIFVKFNVIGLNEQEKKVNIEAYYDSLRNSKET